MGLERGHTDEDVGLDSRRGLMAELLAVSCSRALSLTTFPILAGRPGHMTKFWPVEGQCK